jgi:hypothetical protein
MSGVAGAPRRSVSLGSTIARRGWIVLVSMAIVAALAYAVAGLKSATYTGQAVLSVSSTLGPAAPGAPDQAGRLAGTYVRLIPNDDHLRSFVRQKTGASGSISASRAGGAVIRVTYTSRSRQKAIDGARATVSALSSEKRVTSSVTPGTLEVVRRPRSVTTTGGRSTATALMYVPSGAGRAGVNADQATKLAVTYAGLIGADDTLLSRAAAQVGTTRDDFAGDLQVVNLQDTSLITISYKAKSPRQAAEGARTIAKLVTGPEPATAGIIPASLTAVSLPSNVGKASSGKKTAVAVGLALGFVLGLVLLVAWERSDPHLRDPRDVSAQIGCPATPADRLSDQVIELLLRGGGGTVRYEDARSGALPEERDEPGIGGSVADVVLVHAGAPGGRSAGEAVALGCDLTVVVVPRGARAADVRSLAEELANFGIVPAWCLIAPRRASALAGEPRESVASS